MQEKTKKLPISLTMTAVVAALFSGTLLSIAIAASTLGDTLLPTQTLGSTQHLVSAGAAFRLGFFTPSTTTGHRFLGIWYNTIPHRTVVWVANRETPLPATEGAQVTFTAQGNLVIVDEIGRVHWSTNTSVGKGKAGRVKLLDSGELVVGNGDQSAVRWRSFDHPTDTLLPGMKLRSSLGSREKRLLTSWKSPEDPSSGEYTVELDTRGDPQVFLSSNKSRIWRSGPWNGLWFSGVPEMRTYTNYFTVNFSVDTHEISYSFMAADPTVLSHLVVDSSGHVRRLVWLNDSLSWSTFWLAPKDQCDPYGQCGPYGACDVDSSPVCRCVRGFDPKSPEDWYLRDGRGGCIRRTSLDCRNGTDGFVAVRRVKLPDTSHGKVTFGISLNECESKCKMDCSCTAYAAANISGGVNSGCIIWVSELKDLRIYSNEGQNLYVRLAKGDVGSSSWNRSKTSIMAVLLTASVIISIGFLYGHRRREASSGTSSNIETCYDGSQAGRDLELPLYELATMAAATSNFSDAKRIGEGGFGPVYRGRIDGGRQEVAIKRLSNKSSQGVEEFKNEVMLIAKLQHRNLVRLLGCCVEGEERLLVYEYVPNGSLDSLLFDEEKSTMLDWNSRYQIIVGIARGLVYLHEDSRLRIIHRDLKASNILLDEEMSPKISDFGLARIFGGDGKEVNTKKVVGTFGYMSPEYAMDGVLTVKLDVFSFGVLVLEIITGKKNRGFYHLDPTQNLLGHVWNLWVEGNSLEMVDKSMGYSFPSSEVLKCIKIGLLSVQETPENRPNMSSVILMLGGDDALIPQPKRPGFARDRDGSPMLLPSSSMSEVQGSSINGVTVTTMEGR